MTWFAKLHILRAIDTKDVLNFLYKSRSDVVLKVGLTGGIGCGKSTAVDFFKAYGVQVIDADHIAKALVEPGQPALQEVASLLGDRFIQDDGALNRALLKQEVFSDNKLLTTLESILHARIRDEISAQMNQAALIKNITYSKYPYLIVDIPLLIEKKYQNLFDEIVVVTCSQRRQRERVKSRDHLSDEAITAIMSRQATTKERLAIATKTLDNDSSKQALEKQVAALHTQFVAK